MARTNPRGWILAAICIGVAAAGGYVAGLYSYAKNVGPIDWLRSLRRHAQFEPETRIAVPVYDEYARLRSFPGKAEVPCPAPTERTRTLLLIGQSNAANYAGQRYESAHGDKVLNQFGGRCFIAASPLIGTTGGAGESWTLLGNRLVESGWADRVILIAAAIGGTPIRRWKEGSDLNVLLLSVLDDVRSKYQVTHVLWHQGESDFAAQTPEQDYASMFRSLVASIRKKGVSAPVFVSVASKCGFEPNWRPDNPVTRAQRSLVDEQAGIFPGVDTDSLMDTTDRYEDCHFSASGQRKFVDGWFDVLRKER